MKLREIINRSAPLPIWIDEDENSTRYDEPNSIPLEYYEAEVKYITVDGSGELTIEIER